MKLHVWPFQLTKISGDKDYIKYKEPKNAVKIDFMKQVH